jgi:hypothetical protein
VIVTEGDDNVVTTDAIGVVRLDAIGVRDDAIGVRDDAIGVRVDAVGVRVDAIGVRVDAIGIAAGTIGVRVDAMGVVVVDGGSDIFSFIPPFSKIVVFGVDTRSKFSSSDILSAETSFPVGELMFFSFIRLKIFTFKSPVLAAVVTEKRNHLGNSSSFTFIPFYKKMAA